MSFILDALRKSEHERQMESAPDIMHAPIAVPRPHLPVWAIVLMGGLAAALVAVTFYTFTARLGEPAPGRGVTVQDPRSPLESVLEPTAGGAAPQTPAATTPDSPAIAADPAGMQTAPAAGNSLTAAEVSAPVLPEPEVVPDINPGQLPGYAAVVADGISVGALQMQLHVHSSVAASRFVVINGVRRREGDQLPEGPRVEEIVAEGAVLSYQGQRFLLMPN